MNGKNSLTVDEKLALVSFDVDRKAHITVEKALCKACTGKPCLSICAAENYKWDEEADALIFNCEGCFECGACRIICPRDAIDWSYPQGGYGVRYRFG
jgi:ferredoxin like protein